MDLLKGTIFITDSVDVVYNTDLRMTKIITLDEDGILEESKDIISGTCLLPPIDAKIAEVDGREDIYDKIYSEYLLQPFQQQFISAIIAYLYKGGNMILFLPELGYTNTINKLVEHLYRFYGIHPGFINTHGDLYPEMNLPVVANCYYDAKCIPIWLNLIYCANVISAEEYLARYPQDAVLSNETVIRKLIDELRPFGATLNQKIATINNYRAKLNVVQGLIMPVRSLE